jgi:hypothetical protein
MHYRHLSNQKPDYSSRHQDGSIPRHPNQQEAILHSGQSQLYRKEGHSSISHSASMPKLQSASKLHQSHVQIHDTQIDQVHPFTQRPHPPQIRPNFVSHDAVGSEESKKNDSFDHQPSHQTSSWQYASNDAIKVIPNLPPMNHSAQYSSVPSKQHNAQFSMLSEQINNATNEVMRLAQAKNVKIDDKGVHSTEDTEEEINLPLLTNNEKEVRKMKV